MLNNYEYFIALAEEQNVSQAAERLFVSHQCLSKYLKNLEQEYNTTFFDRSPKLTLTVAGQAYLDFVREIQFVEKNFNEKLDDIKQSKRGLLRFGTTEGRYRILAPTLLSEFRRMYPQVNLEMHYGTTEQLYEGLLDNTLDVALVNQSIRENRLLDVSPIQDEVIYLVISDNLLQKYFPEQYPACKTDFLAGVDLRKFKNVPFILSPAGMNSRERLDQYLEKRNIQLNIASEVRQMDLAYMLAMEDYAASFCWSMYVRTIVRENLRAGDGHLNIFPIKGANITNRVLMVTKKGKVFQTYGKDFMKLVKETCNQHASLAAPEK